MCCPYFYPAARIENGNWAVAPRVPLLDMCGGECRAGEHGIEPPNFDLCNNGYARGACDRFPNDAACDAVRFHAITEGGGVRVQFIAEKNWWPVAHGDPDQSGSDMIRRQAAVFVDNFRRRSA